jgi:hypothetical protein
MVRQDRPINRSSVRTASVRSDPGSVPSIVHVITSLGATMDLANPRVSACEHPLFSGTGIIPAPTGDACKVIAVPFTPRSFSHIAKITATLMAVTAGPLKNMTSARERLSPLMASDTTLAPLPCGRYSHSCLSCMHDGHVDLSVVLVHAVRRTFPVPLGECRVKKR